jgi:hypothetical protein
LFSQRSRLLWGSASAQTSANGPYYATPSWSQQLPVATRFIVLANWNNEAVLDRETGLVWQRDPSVGGNLNYLNSALTCNQARTGGRFGWRLPSLHEFSSLFDPANTATAGVVALPTGHPFTNVVLGPYWTGSTNSSNSANAWTFNPTPFNPGGFVFCCGVVDFPKSGVALPQWCVRGGGTASEQ